MREANDGRCTGHRKVRAVHRPTTYVTLQELCQAFAQQRHRM